MKSVIQKKLFTKNECDYFKSLSNNKIFDRSKVTEYSSLNITSDHRTSQEVSISLDIDLSNMILQKIKEFGIKTLPNYFIILKYDKNQEFKRHSDSGVDNSGIVEYPNRYKTMIIQLSEKCEYEGGELCIFEKDKELIASKDIGNVIIFDSSIEHCANKIEEGIRYSMVFWLSIDNFGLNKSLI
jgi:predicted 2-oxoglutarate/Fe(II)-dependent dioxygenase YbiX